MVVGCEIVNIYRMLGLHTVKLVVECGTVGLISLSKE